MPASVSPEVVVVLLDRQDRTVFEFTSPYNEVAELTVIRRSDKFYVYQPVYTTPNMIQFREAKVVLDFNEVKGTTKLKADFVRDPRALDHTLFLLQHNEISLAKAKEIVEYWAVGIDPLSSDLPVVSQDNPLLSENDAPMDILREVREDIIKRRELDVEAALVVQEIADHCDDFSEWKKKLIPVIDHLRSHSHGKPVSEEFKAKYTIKVAHPMRPGQIAELRVEEGQMLPEFIFRVHEDNILTEGQKAAGMEQDFIPGVGPAIRMPIKPDQSSTSEAPSKDGDPMAVAIAVINDIEAASELAMKQFRHNVKQAIYKFRNQGN